MQTSLTTFSSMMSEQFAALTNSVGEIQQRLINLEENMTLSSMVSITVFSLLAVVWLHLLISSSRDRKLSLYPVEYCFLDLFFGMDFDTMIYLFVKPWVLMKNVHFSNWQRLKVSQWKHLRYIYLSDGIERSHNLWLLLVFSRKTIVVFCCSFP